MATDHAHVIAPPGWLGPRPLPGTDGISATLALKEELERLASPHAPVIALGGEDSALSARSMGLHVIESIPRIATGWSGMARSLSRVCRDLGVTQVTAWGCQAAQIAGRAAAHNSRLTTGARVLYPLDTSRKPLPLIELTVPNERVGADSRAACSDASVIAVNPDLGIAWDRTTDRSERHTLREQLGISASDHVIAPLVDDPRSMDAARFAFLLGVLDLMGNQLVGIIPAGAGKIAEAFAFVRSASLDLTLIVAETSLMSVLPAADTALLDGAMLGDDSAARHPHALAVLTSWARCHGVRVEGDVTPVPPGRPVPPLPPTLRWATRESSADQLDPTPA